MPITTRLSYEISKASFQQIHNRIFDLVDAHRRKLMVPDELTQRSASGKSMMNAGCNMFTAHKRRANFVQSSRILKH